MAKFAFRTKGGVCRIDGMYHALIDIWDNADCEGASKRWISHKSFATEAAAMRYYVASVRPRLLAAHEKLAKETDGSIEWRKSLEDFL